MSIGRPPIPRPLRRAVEVEAGHRCAVTTCRQTSGLEIHHILEWAKVKEHTFDNLILVCAVCHARATRGEIDRQAMNAYKANLRVLNGRYGDLERRVLNHFLKHPDQETITVDRSHRVLLDYLIEDGLLEEAGAADGSLWLDDRGAGPGEGPQPGDIVMGPALWRLTDQGKGVVESLRSATILE